jgi:NAD+ kinase
MNSVIKRIGFLAHPRRPESVQVVQQIAEHTQSQGLGVWYLGDWTEDQVRGLLGETDLLVALGGDGAMLHAARLCAPLGVPVMGINMGYLGFLTEIRPEQWPDCLQKIMAGDYWLESRLMVTGEVFRQQECLLREDALNDVVVSRGALAKTVHLEVYIDEAWATSYHADGLIIATATGSTAYALAVGGPILPPEMNNFMMVPVAPHLSMERPIILSQGAHVKIVVSSRTQADVAMSIDGSSSIYLQPGDEVFVRASENRSLFMRVQGRSYFFRSLMDRMEPRFLSNHPPQENE